MQHFQTVIARHGAGGYAQHLKIVEYVRFNTGKAGFCRRQVVRFNGKCNVLVFDKPVVAFGKLVFEHIRILGTNGIESVVLCRNVDSLFRFSALRPLIDERELHAHTRVKVVEKIAPVFKNGSLVVCLCKLIVNIFKHNALAVFLFLNPANPIREHLQVGNGLLRGVRFSVALCLLDKGGNLFLFGAGQFTLCSCGGFPRLWCLCL